MIQNAQHRFELQHFNGLDFVSRYGIYNLPRRHPALVAEFKKAVPETDQGNFPMISREKADLAEALSDFVPGGLNCSIFSVTRGEAVDAACKIARGYTGRSMLTTAIGSYFGETGFAVSVGNHPLKNQLGELIPNVAQVSNMSLENMLQFINDQTAAVILELVQTESGCEVLKDGWLRQIRRRCDETGALLVLDETQTGFGRTGHRFEFMRHSVTPDILVIGEALGGGLFPIAATLLTPEVNEFLNEHPMIHLSTFGGSDLGCRVAQKALEIYETEKPWQDARGTGNWLRTRLEAARTQYPNLVKEVNGRGCLQALHLSNRRVAEDLRLKLLERRILVAPARLAEDAIIFRPPLSLSPSDKARFSRALNESLSAVGGSR